MAPRTDCTSESEGNTLVSCPRTKPGRKCFWQKKPGTWDYLSFCDVRRLGDVSGAVESRLYEGFTCGPTTFSGTVICEVRSCVRRPPHPTVGGWVDPRYLVRDRDAIIYEESVVFWGGGPDPSARAISPTSLLAVAKRVGVVTGWMGPDRSPSQQSANTAILTEILWSSPPGPGGRSTTDKRLPPSSSILVLSPKRKIYGTIILVLSLLPLVF